MSQEIVQRILTIEQDAAKLYEDAQQQAADLIAQVEASSAALHTQRIADAQQQAERIKVAGEEQAEAERAHILAQAGADAQRLDTLAAKNFDRAVASVLAEVIGKRDRAVAFVLAEVTGQA